MSTVDKMRAVANLCVERGLVVKYSSGWESRGRPYSFNPTAGVIAHHTGGAEDIDNVLINGRSDLPGPLCQYALHKNGDVVLIAAGYANHAGESQSGAPSNSNGWGIEATGPQSLDGYGPSTFPNYDEYGILLGCILDVEGWPSSKIWGHKESCYPEGRKVDPFLDMDQLRKDAEEGGDMGMSSGDWDKMNKQFADIDSQVAALKQQLSDVYAALARGNQAGNLPPTDQHWKDSHRGIDTHISDIYKALARGEMDYGIDASSQHYKDSHRGIYSLLLEVKKGLTGGGWAQEEE